MSYIGNKSRIAVFDTYGRDQIDGMLRDTENSAGAAAQRAETAADAAFVNADVFDDIATGLAATDDGEQFQVVDGLEVVRYRNESGSAVEVARYPASEFVNIALDVASQSGLVSGEFYADDSEQPIYSITDEDGNALATWDQQGEMDANPSLEMAEKSQQARSEFHNSDDQPAFALTDEEGRPLYAVDENGQPIVPFITEFHTDDDQPSYAWTDKDGVVFYGIDAKGRAVVGGGGLKPDEIPDSSVNLAAPQAYWDRGALRRAVRMDELMASEERTEFTVPHTKQYAFFDELMSRWPDQISSEVLGQSELGQDIRAYTFDFTQGRYGSTDFDRADPIEIIITAGIHGNEWNSQILNMVIAKGICDHWREDPVYAKLRWECVVRFIPCANPDGIDAESRRNANGVNLNRNFPTDWSESISDSGPAPSSEAETQVLQDLPLRYPGARIYLDLHTHWGTSYYLWIIATNQTDYNLAEYHARSLCYYQVNDVGDDEYAPKHIYPASGPLGTMVRHMGIHYGLTAFLHETVHGTAAQHAAHENGSQASYKRFGLRGILILLDRLIDREIRSKTTH